MWKGGGHKLCDRLSVGGLLTSITSKGVMESKFVLEAQMPSIKNYKKRSVVLGISAGTIQENSRAEDRPGTNFSGEKSKENAPVTADLRDTNGGGERFTNLAFAVLVVVAIELFVITV